MKDEARHAEVPPPIACSLSEPELAERRRELTREVFGGALGVEDLEDGYEFVYPGSVRWATRLVEIINAERACCPFFAFELRFEPGGGPILLRVRGPGGAKEFVEAGLIGPDAAAMFGGRPEPRRRDKLSRSDKGASMGTGNNAIVSRDPDVVSGELVFAGTRVPVKNLVDYIKTGHTLEDFLEGFPTVTREQAEGYLTMTLETAELARLAR